MQVAHQALQALLNDVCVNLGCRNIRMTQQRLHNAQVCPVVQQMRSKCVAQHMWADKTRLKSGGGGKDKAASTESKKDEDK